MEQPTKIEMPEATQDSMETLEKLDVPRGVVKAANLYAGKIVNLTEIVKAGQTNPKIGPRLLMAARVVYDTHFNSFIEGAKWAHANGGDNLEETADGGQA